MSFALLSMVLALLAQGPAGEPASTSPSTPRDELRARVEARIAEYDAAYAAWYEEYLATEGKNHGELPDKAPVARELLALVARDPAGEAAFLACQWSVSVSMQTEVRDAALEVLREHHLENPMIELIASGVHAGTPAANRFLAAALERATTHERRGKLCYELGRGLAKTLYAQGTSADERERNEAAALAAFERCATEFAEVVLIPDPSGEPSGDVTLGARVERDLHELRALAPGKTAPDIVGEDLDGVPFRLSDHRGKVVMLDFWGDW